MREFRQSIWYFHKKGHYVVVTTNGTIKKNGSGVMGRGIAAQAAKRYPELPAILGEHIKKNGNVVGLDEQHKIIFFPVKHDWWEAADIALIEKSAKELAVLAENLDGKIYSVRPGCGNGGLLWDDVKDIIEPYFGDRIFLVNPPQAS
jgi:hypothetical protein